MKLINAILIILVLLLQHRLWFGKNSIGDYLTLKERVAHQSEQNLKLEQRNKLLYADIDDLKNGLEAIEENARNELGMIKEGEVFFRVIPKEN
ncbi:cell division protein FtsB [Thalassotalea mangrovi]|uniref:Cell division protein FtsB n=1 Tax=Thalassotalea mangrovi TaxID=2572245 RepID=A0A4U1B6J2_9GAMM|nr:cell division protein FtsB [Thalassotalea mangrovi]TKB46161.1 cell division protein FtsB [Thalassotalea mangrovi]